MTQVRFYSPLSLENSEAYSSTMQTKTAYVVVDFEDILSSQQKANLGTINEQ